MKRAYVALLVALVACGDDNGSEPGEDSFDGTWVGTYTNSESDVTASAELQLSQNDEQVTGTLTTGTGRTATLTADVSGDVLEGTFTYTDECEGTATTTADLVDEVDPPELSGVYSATDCEGESTGSYELTKE